jgi:hypothetical protein
LEVNSAGQNSGQGIADPSSHISPRNSSPVQGNNPFSQTESSNSAYSEFSSPESTVKGRGPMLPQLQTDIIGESDPTVTKEETFDDTPLQGMKNLNEVYDLLLTEGEPTNFKEATGNKEWEQAMESQISSIEKNKTWELTDLPPGHRPIGLKWVYKLKRDANGVVTRQKARLVAKGYIQ